MNSIVLRKQGVIVILLLSLLFLASCSQSESTGPSSYGFGRAQGTEGVELIPQSSTDITTTEGSIFSVTAYLENQGDWHPQNVEAVLVGLPQSLAHLSDRKIVVGNELFEAGSGTKITFEGEVTQIPQHYAESVYEHPFAIDVSSLYKFVVSQDLCLGEASSSHFTGIESVCDTNTWRLSGGQGAPVAAKVIETNSYTLRDRLVTDITVSLSDVGGQQGGAEYVQLTRALLGSDEITADCSFAQGRAENPRYFDFVSSQEREATLHCQVELEHSSGVWKPLILYLDASYRKSFPYQLLVRRAALR